MSTLYPFSISLFRMPKSKRTSNHIVKVLDRTPDKKWHCVFSDQSTAYLDEEEALARIRKSGHQPLYTISCVGPRLAFGGNPKSLKNSKRTIFRVVYWQGFGDQDAQLTPEHEIV